MVREKETRSMKQSIKRLQNQSNYIKNQFYRMKFSLFAVTVLFALACVQRSSATCRHQPGLVYIIHFAGSDYYKVGGTTRTVQDRIREIQIGNPHQLLPLFQYAVHDCNMSERAAHIAVAQFLHSSEWYLVPRHNLGAFMNTVHNAAANPGNFLG